MSEIKTLNRWWVVVGAMVIQISLGAVYIWSVFQTPLKAYFPDWTETQVTLPAKVVLAFFALSVIIGGRFQDKFGPRIVATAGGLTLGLGLILARFTGHFESTGAIIWLILTFSVIGGCGIGIAYVCPIATCVKWFPDKRGLITGLAVAGFGAGAFFFAPLAKAFVSDAPYQLFNIPLFVLPKIGVFNTFLALGVIFLIAIVLGAQLLKNPPTGYSPANWLPTIAKQPLPTKQDYTAGEMIKTPVFWLLWITYFFGCTAGLMVIMKASPIWQSFAIGNIIVPIEEQMFVGTAAAGATAVSILAIFNASGRILWGKLSDVMGRRQTLFVMFLLCGTAMLLLNGLRVFPLYLLGVCTIGLCFGGFLSLYPAITADYFGSRYIGVNYGWMFTAFGAGGVVGPYLAALLMQTAGNVIYTAEDMHGQTVEKVFTLGNYQSAFVVAGLACLMSAILITQIKPPQPHDIVAE